MLFNNNKAMLGWFFIHVGLFFSHILTIWLLYIFAFSYRQAPLDNTIIFWAVAATIIIHIYLFEVLYIIFKFYHLWNRPFLTVIDYYQWYIFNRRIAITSILPLLFTTFFALRKLPINVDSYAFQGTDYLIYLIFIPILIFNGFIVWYNYKYKRIIKAYT